MRRPVMLLVALALLAGCGGSSKQEGPDPTAATATTLAGASARFTVLVGALLGGQQLQTSETGQISFRSRRAHIYKLLANGGVPQEVVVIGPLTYTNANIDRAMRDPKVRP